MPFRNLLPVKGVVTLGEPLFAVLMKKMIRAYLAILSIALGICVVGCTPEGREDMSQGAEKMGEGIKKDADATGKVIKSEGTKLGQELKPVIKNAGKTIDAATMTGKVKNVLNETRDVDSSKIDVDTKDGVVHLTGSVPNAAQKAESGKLAQGVAGKDYKVSNELTVAANKP